MVLVGTLCTLLSLPVSTRGSITTIMGIGCGSPRACGSFKAIRHRLALLRPVGSLGVGKSWKARRGSRTSGAR